MKTILKKLGSNILLKVKSGPLQGYRWIAGSGIKFIKGTYEPKTIKFLQDNIKEGDTCYDIGGHVGYIALTMGKLAGDTGKVTVFEPRPININYIERHVSANQIKNVALLKTGVSNYEGVARFDMDTGTGTGKISSGGVLEIKVQTIDTLFDNGEITAPNFIKMDIEGEETKALRGAEKVLKTYKPVLNISTHGKDIYDDCVAYIGEEIGYGRVERFPGGFIAFEK